MNITKQRQLELLQIARDNANNIMGSWWEEFGSWDGLTEDEELTVDEVHWIWDNITYNVSVRKFTL